MFFDFALTVNSRGGGFSASITCQPFNFVKIVPVLEENSEKYGGFTQQVADTHPRVFAGGKVLGVSLSEDMWANTCSIGPRLVGFNWSDWALVKGRPWIQIRARHHCLDDLMAY
jgi:hypothetical protein